MHERRGARPNHSFQVQAPPDQSRLQANDEQTTMNLPDFGFGVRAFASDVLVREIQFYHGNCDTRQRTQSPIQLPSLHLPLAIRVDLAWSTHQPNSRKQLFPTSDKPPLHRHCCLAQHQSRRSSLVVSQPRAVAAERHEGCPSRHCDQNPWCRRNNCCH